MAEKVKYDPWVGLRKATWVALYSVLPTLIQSLTDNLNASQDLKRYWWFPPLMGVLVMAGNGVKVWRKNRA